MCQVLHKAKIIERFDFDPVSAKCKIRIAGKWSKAEKERLLQLGGKEPEVKEKLHAIIA